MKTRLERFTLAAVRHRADRTKRGQSYIDDVMQLAERATSTHVWLSRESVQSIREKWEPTHPADAYRATVHASGGSGVGARLRRKLGCGCESLPFREWDAAGPQWCRDHREEIAHRIADTPKARTSYRAALLFVDDAINELVAEQFPRIVAETSKIRPSENPRGPIHVEPAPRIRAKVDKIPPLITPRDPDRDDARLVTFHFNPCRYRSHVATYYRWIETLGPLRRYLRVYELVFDDDAPELEGSVVIRGTRERNVMFQKEALVNRALTDCPPNVRYFGWLDHDQIITDPDWLAKALHKLRGDVKAVQLFSAVMYMDANDVADIKIHGRVAAFPKGNPGGAWLADRRYLDSIGGLIDNNIIGGGDQGFLACVLPAFNSYLDRYDCPLADANRQQIAEARKVGGRCDFLPGINWHIYHGHTKHRQYQSRVKILNRHQFDPATDIRKNADGIWEWCSDKPELHRDVMQYFIDRKDDS